MDTTVWNTKISEFENKVLDHAKYITTRVFNKLITENFASRLKQGNLVIKTDFENKLTRFNRKITSNKTKYSEVLQNLNSVITKYYNFFLDRIYFTSNEKSHNTFFIIQYLLH